MKGIYSYLIKEYTEVDKKMNLSTVKAIASKIKSKVDKDRKPPVGNQNCLLCTWCSEAQLRGYNELPRPVLTKRYYIQSY